MRSTDVALETLFLRFITPMALWKLMRRLNVGPEREMAAARRAIDSFVAETVGRRRADKNSEIGAATDGDSADDLLSSFLSDETSTGDDGNSTGDEFIRDAMVNFLVAGRDGIAAALSWFFYLVSTNPRVEQKLLAELSLVVAARNGAGSVSDVDDTSSGMVTLDASETNGLVYLHAALCESLRLYPPVPFEQTSTRPRPPPTYCLAGRSSRQATRCCSSTTPWAGWRACGARTAPSSVPRGGSPRKIYRLRHEPSYKFFSFNAGPRTCLGKQMAFVQMKTAAAAVLWNFAVDVVPGHVVEPKLSIILHMKLPEKKILHMKNGLAVRVRRRDDVMGHGRS
ncbi:uncharacterized protein C2845_PM15G09090 [Panicum miliaceum]|uniref:Alkane hydroxylase MAH1-like n=1 Tax=Panicum miliaceum TaxID=4540 RepID=A0A3L6Q8Z3_PANMI|nr:uncharacterized protein C2845_PM15G09090 [Panicum miliaceum]